MSITNKRKNKSAKTKMTEAFFDLLETTPYKKIQILDICKKAGVSRQSYYCCFNDKSQIISNFLDSKIDHIIHEVKVNNLSQDKTYDFVLDFFNENERVFKLIFKNQLDHLLVIETEKKIRALYGDSYFGEDDADLAFAYYTCGFIGLIKKEFTSKGRIVDTQKTKQTLINLINGHYIKD